METPGITAAPSARTSNPVAPKISPLLPGSGSARARRAGATTPHGTIVARFQHLSQECHSWWGTRALEYS